MAPGASIFLSVTNASSSNFQGKNGRDGRNGDPGEDGATVSGVNYCYVSYKT